jgi:hypothetical protein
MEFVVFVTAQVAGNIGEAIWSVPAMPVRIRVK